MKYADINKTHRFCAILVIIFFVIASCTKEAPTVNPADYIQDSPIGGEPGYYYPFVSAIYPANGAIDVPVNSGYVIVFNIPVNGTDLNGNITVTSGNYGTLISGSDYTITPNSGSTSVAQITFSLDASRGEPNQLRQGDPISVVIGSGIRDAANNVPLNNPGTWSFTAGTAPDVTAPAITGGTNSPTGSGLALNTTIQLTFNETPATGEIDITSVNSTTFYVEDSSFNRVACTYSYAAATNTVTLIPTSNLQSTMTYTVNVITPGIKDMSGNNLAAGTTWSFTTANLNLNDTDFIIIDTGTNGIPAINHLVDLTAAWGIGLGPVYVGDYVVNTNDLAIATITAVTNNDLTLSNDIFPFPSEGYEIRRHVFPTITGPAVASVTSTTASLSWTTSEATDYTIRYGRGDDTTSTITSPVGYFSSMHSYPLNPLNAGQRYYVKIDYRDFAGNAGATSSIVEFNTGTSEAPLAPVPRTLYSIDTADERQLDLRWIERKLDVANSGAFMLWRYLDASSTYYSIYCQRYDNTLTAQWNGGNPVPLFTEPSQTYVYGSAVEDGLGGTIVVASRGTEVRAKRVDNAGSIVDWGVGTTSNDLGLRIDSIGGTNASAVPVYSGFIQKVTSGTATMNNLTANTFYDFNTDFSTVANNDIAVNTATHSGTTVTVSNNFRHALTQSVVVVSPGNSYSIVDGVTNNISDTAQSHTIGAINYNLADASTTLYSSHAFVLPAWQNNGDYINVNGVYAQITGRVQIIGFCTIHATNDFYQYTVDTNVDIQSNPAYTIYGYKSISGTAVTPPAEPLYDNTANFTNLVAPLPVVAGDIVINYTDLANPNNPNVGTVNTGSFAIRTRALDMTLPAGSGMFADAENYNIIRFLNGINLNAGNIVDTGIATGGTANSLQDTTNAFALVNTGDVVYNITDDQYAMITNVAVNNLTLSRDATFSNTDRYLIVRGTGVLYVWQNGANIQATVRSMANGTLLRAEYTLVANAQNSHTAADGNGNAFVIYEDTAGEIRARLINAAGLDVWTTPPDPEIDAQTADNENILKVISDGAGGIVVLYQYGATPQMHAQRISDAGVSLWGANGYNLGNTAAIDSISAVDMAYNGASDIIVAAQIGNDIWTARAGATTWAGYFITDNTNPKIISSNQRNPKIFTDWTDATIVWEDDRFASNAGYGIFGMKIVAATGAKHIPPAVPSWRANATGTNDYNGVSVMLNSANKFRPNIQVVTYNNGAGAALIWEDWRNIDAALPYNGSDILYIGLDTFTPY